MSIMCPTHLHINPACPQNYEVNLSLAGSNVHNVSDTLTQTICTTTKWSNVTHRFQFNVNTVSDTATHNYPQNYQMKLSLSDSKIHNVSNTLTQIVHYEVQLTTVHHHLQRSFLDHVIHWNKMDDCIFFLSCSFKPSLDRLGQKEEKCFVFLIEKKCLVFLIEKKRRRIKPHHFTQSSSTRSTSLSYLTFCSLLSFWFLLFCLVLNRFYALRIVLNTLLLLIPLWL